MRLGVNHNRPVTDDGAYKNNDGDKAGFTMTEVIVASLIFALAAAGVIATVTALQQPAMDTSKSETAAMVGQQVLEQLRGKVSPDSWNSGNLTVGTHAWPSQTIDNITYDVSYTVSDDTSGTRKVAMNVTW